MKKFLVAIGLVAVLGACGGGADESPEEPAEEAPVEEEQTGDDAEAGAGEVTYDAARAEETYQGNCMACHGQNLEGANGPQLAGGAVQYEVVLDAIGNGRTGMPANLVEGEEAENLAAWIIEQ